MTTFATNRDARPTRARTDAHDTTFNKDTHMFHSEIRLGEIQELHEQHRAIRHAERHSRRRERSIRLRLGQLLMRLGRRVGGDALTTPAWQG